MTAIVAKQVQELRQKTGAGMMDAKKALQECQGDLTKAIEFLRKKGLAKAGKKADRKANEGLITSYIHAGGKIGVLLEVNCETDFVALNEDFKSLVYDIAMHIAASNPRYLSTEEVDSETLDKEKEIYLEQAKNEGKPQDIAEKIAEGKLSKFYEQHCLLKQAFVKDPSKTIETLVKEHIATIGENIVISRFCRYELGQEEE